MLPPGDRHPGPHPMATWALMAASGLCFLLELNQPSTGAMEAFLRAWGMVPREYTAGRDLAPYIPLPFWTTMLTSTFLHGGLAHLVGNLLYLWMVGGQIERTVGHGRFLACYVACGVASGLCHLLVAGPSSVPLVGASGAISGLLAVYLVLFRGGPIRLLTRSGVVAVPATVLLGLWILIQLVNDRGALTAMLETGGRAHASQVGAFVAGLALGRALGASRRSMAWT